MYLVGTYIKLFLSIPFIPKVPSVFPHKIRSTESWNTFSSSIRCSLKLIWNVFFVYYYFLYPRASRPFLYITEDIASVICVAIVILSTFFFVCVCVCISSLLHAHLLATTDRCKSWALAPTIWYGQDPVRTAAPRILGRQCSRGRLQLPLHRLWTTASRLKQINVIRIIYKQWVPPKCSTSQYEFVGEVRKLVIA